MTDDEVKEFERVIKAQLLALDSAEALGVEGQATVELDQQAVGRLSRMDALQNQAMAKATHARRGVEKTRLKAALERISEGEYGFCEDCGDDIALGRLEFDPAALLCISCASG